MKNGIGMTKHILINAGFFQVLWFAAVFQHVYWAIAFLIFMGLHAVSVLRYNTVELSKIVFLASLGIGFDACLQFLDVYDFGEGYVALPLTSFPLWLSCLWLGFGLTLLSSLKWLLEKPLWFVVSCSLMGPISYLAGRRLDALQFSDVDILWLVAEWLSFSILAIVLLGLNLEEGAQASSHSVEAS